MTSLRPGNDKPHAPARKKTPWWQNVVGLVILAALIFGYLAFSTALIPSTSMEPTLMPGDEILVERAWAAYPFGMMPARGDIVTFKFSPAKQIKDAVNTGQTVAALTGGMGDKPGTKLLAPILLIKRVVGVAGDTVQLVGNTLMVNGSPVKYDYATIPETEPGLLYPYAVQQPITVPPGHVFVLGDNRSNSDDGRFWGTLPAKKVVGKFIRVFAHRKIVAPQGDPGAPYP